MCKAAPCPWQPGSAQCAMFRIGKCKGSGGARTVHRDLQSANPADLCLWPQNDKHGFLLNKLLNEKIRWVGLTFWTFINEFVFLFDRCPQWLNFPRPGCNPSSAPSVLRVSYLVFHSHGSGSERWWGARAGGAQWDKCSDDQCIDYV